MSSPSPRQQHRWYHRQRRRMPVLPTSHSPCLCRFLDRCFGHLQPTLLQRAKPSNFLLDRKKTDKLKKKKKRKRRDSDVPGKEGHVGACCSWKPTHMQKPPRAPLCRISPGRWRPLLGLGLDTFQWVLHHVSPDQVKEIKTEGQTDYRPAGQAGGVPGTKTVRETTKDIMVDSGEWPRGGDAAIGFQDPLTSLPLQGLWVQSLVEELRSHVPAMRCGVSMRWFLPWKGTGEHTPPPSGERVQKADAEMFRKG